MFTCIEIGRAIVCLCLCWVQRKRFEAEEKAAAEKARLAKVKPALDEDKAERRLRSQLMSGGAVQSTAQAQNPATGGGVVGS